METKMVLFAVILLIVLIVLILFITSKGISHFESGSGSSDYNQDNLVCRSPAAISAAKNYYDNVGEYHGVFTMDPISSYQVGPTLCDVKYKYIPTPTSPRNDSLVDSRRFEYRNGPEGWHVVNMLGWKSGVLNM